MPRTGAVLPVRAHATDEARLDKHLRLYDSYIARFRGKDSPAPRRPHTVRVLPFKQIGRPGVFTLHDVLLLSGEWQVLDADSVIMDAYVVQPVPPRSAYLMGVNPSRAQVMVEEPSELALPEGASTPFVLGGARNYAHWVLDTLPRLAFLQGVPATAPLLTFCELPAFAEESLTLAGVGQSRLLHLPYPEVLRIKELLMPSTASGSGTSPLVLQPAAVRWLRETYLPREAGVLPPPVKRTHGRRLFVSRATDAASKARLVNHKEVEQAAARLGFESVTLEGKTFAEQVALFAQAGVVTGPHGAGFANMAFAPAGATLVELMGPVVARVYTPTMFYPRLAAVCGLRYARVVGEPLDPEQTDPLHPSTEKYRIDPAKLLAAMRDVLGS